MSNPLQHKDPKGQERPPIPLPDPDEVRHTFDVALAKVRERQGFYIAMTTIVLLVAIGAIFLLNLGPSTDSSSDFIGLWSRADAVKRKLVADESAAKEIADLESYLQHLRGTKSEGTALWLLGIYEYREAWTGEKVTADDRRPHLEKAIRYLSELGQAKFDELLVTKPNWYTPDSATPASALLKQVRVDLEWVNTNAYTEPLPSPSTVAVLRTSEGDVHLQFFSDLCPEHTNNFISLARKGTYNDTLFHFVRRGYGEDALGVMGGDPYTFFYNDPQNKKHVLRWGSGGVGYDLPPEGGRYRIYHRAGIVTSQMAPDADWNNGVQFMIMLGTDVDLDKRHTPFAKVVEGLGVAEKLAARKTAGDHATFKDDPDFSTIATRDLIIEPAILYKVIVYENGKALQHDFPLADGEQSLSALSGAPGQALEGDAAYCGRALRALDAGGDPRLGLDIPFPADIADPTTTDPKGERIIRAPK